MEPGRPRLRRASIATSLSLVPLLTAAVCVRARSAVFAAPLNLRRDTIDEEIAWIRSRYCSGSTVAARATCAVATTQFDRYNAIETRRAGANWTRLTRCIEGALYLVELRSPIAQCLLCAWWNEYAFGSERDQLSWSYVAYALGLAWRLSPQRNGSASSSTGAAREPSPHVHLLPRALHWSVNVRKDTRVRYNRTREDALQLARRFVHARGRSGG